jgi:hypothetical protein
MRLSSIDGGRYLARMGKWVAALFAVFVAACSSESPPPPSGDPGGSGGTGNAPDASAPDEGTSLDASGADAVGPGSDDGGIPANKEPVLVSGPLSRQSCDAVCTAKTYQCSTLCTPGSRIAGTTVYANTVNNFTVYKQPPIATCAEVVAATYEEFDTVYELESYKCCCLAPKITRIAGDANSPTSCAAVCTAHGLTCNPETTFSGGKDGDETTWTGPDATLILLHDCAYVPTKTTVENGRTYTLRSYTCGCS